MGCSSSGPATFSRTSCRCACSSPILARVSAGSAVTPGSFPLAPPELCVLLGGPAALWRWLRWLRSQVFLSGARRRGEVSPEGSHGGRMVAAGRTWRGGYQQPAACILFGSQLWWRHHGPIPSPREQELGQGWPSTPSFVLQREFSPPKATSS